MCECGCVGNDDKYSLPGPSETIYLVSIAGACENCDAPPGITIEQIKPGSWMYEEYVEDEIYGVKPLAFEDWPDSKGVAIVTGMRKHEFITAMMSHLIGVDSRKLGENGVIDKYGADVIAEEMYGDSWVQPFVVDAPQ